MKRSYSERIAIMAPEEAKDATGAAVITYGTLLGERWADVVPRTSREFESLRVQHEEIEAAYNIRGHLAVTMDCRVVHDGQTLEIVGINTADNRKPENAVEITIICRGHR